MTDKQNRSPTHRIYSVTGEGDQARWTEVGAAWANRDGQGFSLSFDAIPTRGRVVMREISAAGENGGQS